MDIQFLFWLFTKHFIVDFPLQGPFQYLNKGTYGHPGGILHAALHGIATFAIGWNFYGFVPGLVVGAIDAVVHYHIDWAKMNINKFFKLQPNTSEQFWWLLGFDQYLHAITYFALVGWANKLV